jgi:hypothetical protein
MQGPYITPPPHRRGHRRGVDDLQCPFHAVPPKRHIGRKGAPFCNLADHVQLWGRTEHPAAGHTQASK